MFPYLHPSFTLRNINVHISYVIYSLPYLTRTITFSVLFNRNYFWSRFASIVVNIIEDGFFLTLSRSKRIVDKNSYVNYQSLRILPLLLLKLNLYKLFTRRLPPSAISNLFLTLILENYYNELRTMHKYLSRLKFLNN